MIYFDPFYFKNGNTTKENIFEGLKKYILCNYYLVCQLEKITFMIQML